MATMKKVKEGQLVFSKNDREVDATITKIVGSKVTVGYEDDSEEWHDTILDISMFKNWDEEGTCWDLPNWTLNY